MLGGLLFAWAAWWAVIVFAWLAVPAWYGRHRLHALSGFLIGFGVAWLAAVMLLSSMARMTEWLVPVTVGIGALATGVALLVGYENTKGSRRAGHELGREDSIAYFRDFGASASGVREEERVGRWGGNDDEGR